MLDYYEDASKIANKKASVIKEDTLKLESSLEIINNNLSDTDDIDKVVADKELKIKNGEELSKKLRELVDQKNKLNNEISFLETGDIEELQKELDSVKLFLLGDMLGLSENLANLYSDHNKKLGVLSEKKRQWELIKDKSKECYTCTQSIAPELRDKLHEKVKNDIKIYETLCASTVILIDKLDKTISDLENKKAKNDKAVEKRKNLKNKLEKYKRNAKYIGKVTEKTKELDKEVYLLSPKGILIIEQELSSLKIEYGSLLEKKKNLDKMKKEKKESKDKLDKLKREFAIFDHLHTIFGKNGIPALIIENAVISITEKANEYLKLIDPSKIIKINTLKETQKGKIKESLDLVVEDYFLNTNDNARPYRTFSGGEKNILDFCLHLALANLLKNRIKANIDFVFLDEIFEKLDAHNLDQMISALNIVRKEFSQVFVISHKPVKDVFPDKIKIVKTAEGSILC